MKEQVQELVQAALDEVDAKLSERLSRLEGALNSVDETLRQRDSVKKETRQLSELCVRYAMSKAANLLGIHSLDFANEHWRGDTALQEMIKLGGVDKFVTRFNASVAVNTQTASSGGLAIPFVVQDDIIENLRATAVVRSLGATEIGPVSGPVPFLRVGGGITPYYVGEGMRIKISKPTFEMISAVPKKMGVMVPFTGEWVRGSIPGVEQALRADMLAAAVEMEDNGLILGDGTQHQPTGLRKWALQSTNIFNATANPTPADVLADLGKPITAMKNKKIPFRNPGWIMSPRTERFLLNLHFANGSYVYRNEMQNLGTLEGYPYRVTPQIPDNLGSANDESFIIFADFGHVYIVDGFMADIEVSNTATFIDDSSNVHSSFQQDMLVMRLLRSFDLIVRHRDAVAIIQAVKWGE